MAPNLTLQQQQAIAKAKARARATSVEPLGNATGEWDLSKFEALPRQQQAPAPERNNFSAPEGFFRSPVEASSAMADTSKAGWGDRVTQSRTNRLVATGMNKIKGNTDTKSEEVSNDLVGGLGDLIVASRYGLDDWWKNTSAKDKVDTLGRIPIELTGTGTYLRLENEAARRRGEPQPNENFQVDETYNPEADLAGLMLNAGSWSTRAAGGGLINPRSAGTAVKNAAADVATNLTMGGSDIAAAGVKGGKKLVEALTPPARPAGPSPAPVSPIPQTGPRAAQGGPPSPGQQPTPGPAPVAPGVTGGQGGGVLNAVPATPVIPKGQIRVAKDTAKILSRIMRSSRIKDADITGYLPGAVQRYKGLNDPSVPFAFFLEGDLPQHFPQPIAEEVVTKLQTWGRERNAATGPQDTSRRTIQQTVKTLREGQQDYLSGVMDQNLYKGKLIGQEDKLKASLKANAQTAYDTALQNANNGLLSGRATVDQRNALGKIQELLHNDAFLKQVPQHLRIKAMREGIDLEDFVQKDPLAAAHWLQSELRQAVSAAEGVGGSATSESRLYGEMRQALLDQLETAVPGYKGARKAHGDIYGAVEALDFGNSFFKAARSEVETARLARQFKALSKRQQTAATMSIRDALKNEFRNKAEDTAAKVTRLQQAGVLEALETVLGADGKRVADGIRNIVKQNDRLKAIDQGSGSPTYSNQRGGEAAREMVQSPVNKAVGAFGDKTSWPMTVAGDVVLASSGLPPVLTAGKAATALVDRFGNPSAKQLSRATEGLYGLPTPPPANALSGPPSPRGGRPRVPAPPPTQQTLDDLLREYDAIDHRKEPGKAAQVLKKIDALKKKLAKAEADASALSAPPSPPVKGPVNKAGFFGSGSKPLDMSEAGRMQRAREQGFDTNKVLYHGTANGGFDEFDPYSNSKHGLFGQGVYLTDDPQVASTYTNKGAAAMERRGREPNKAVYPVYVRLKNPIDMDAPANIDAWRKSLREYSDIDIESGMTNEEVYRQLEDAIAAEGLPMYEGAEVAQDILRSMGHDGVVHVGGGRVDGDGIRHNVTVVFDPENIRGKFAAFDPAQSGSSKLLAGMGMVGKGPPRKSSAIEAEIERAFNAKSQLDDVSRVAYYVDGGSSVEEAARHVADSIGPERASAATKRWNAEGRPSAEDVRKRLDEINSDLNAKQSALQKAQRSPLDILTGDNGIIQRELGAAIFGSAVGSASSPDDPVGGAIKGGLIGAGGAAALRLLPKSKAGVNALKGGAKAAERVGPPTTRGIDQAPKPANDTLPKGQKTPAEDLAMAREFNKEPLTPERAYDFWALLKDEKDLNKVIDVLDINLNPSILSLPRGRAMVERTREEVLRRVTTYLRKETEANKASTLSRANAKFEENNRSIANEITQLRERGVPDQMIARSLGLEDGSLEYFLRWSEPTKPPPAQAGFFSGGKGTPKTKGPKFSPKVVAEVGRLKNRLGPPTYEDGQPRNALAMLQENASKPPGTRVSAMEATGDAPIMFSAATRAQPPVRKTWQPDFGEPFKRGIPKDKTTFTPQLQNALTRAGSAPDTAPANAMIEFRGQQAEKATKAAAKAQRSENAAYNKGWRGDDIKPRVQTRISTEQAKREAIAKLQDAQLPLEDAVVVRERVAARVAEIRKELNARPDLRDFSAKEREEMAKLLFSEEYADTLAKALSGEAPLRARGNEALYLSLAATGGLAALGWTAMLADLNNRSKETMAKNGRGPVAPPVEDPSQTMNWDAFVRNRDKVITLQVYLNRINPKFYLNEDGRYLAQDKAGKQVETKTQRALKFWQQENGFEPTGVMDDEQWALLYSQAEGANAPRSAGSSANALAPAQ